MNPDDICKAAVITKFCLRNAAQSSQRHIDYVLRGLDFASPYLDNILIFSENTASHIYHLHTIFQRLDDKNLLINVKKCEYFVSEVQFLEHSISSKIISTIPTKLNIIKAPPLSKKNLRSFLGAVNFYHRFILMASSLLTPL